MNTNDVVKLKTRTKAEESLALCGDAHPVLCMRAALRLITGKWKAEIMWSLKDGKRRFGELMRGIPGITQHMLTAQLRDMERHGLIARTVYAEVPPRVAYELTPVAIGLKPVFEALSGWAEENAATLRLGEMGEEEDEEGESVPKR